MYGEIYLADLNAVSPLQWIQAIASSWYSCIFPCVILLYANHRLENIRSGPNLAETTQMAAEEREEYF